MVVLWLRAKIRAVANQQLQLLAALATKSTAKRRRVTQLAMKHQTGAALAPIAQCTRSKQDSSAHFPETTAMLRKNAQQVSLCGNQRRKLLRFAMKPTPAHLFRLTAFANMCAV